MINEKMQIFQSSFKSQIQYCTLRERECNEKINADKEKKRIYKERIFTLKMS